MIQTTQIAVRDVSLEVARCGTGEPLLLLHGFTGAAASWAFLQEALADRWHTVAPSLLGHGGSSAPAEPARYRMEECVSDLLALLDALGLERVAVLGYSMGGRVALHLALAAPARVGALVLESASPGIPDAAERVQRVRADEALADDVERDGVAAFVARWERIPLFASQAALPEGDRARLRAQRLRSSAVGLANSLRGMGAGAMMPVVHRLGELQAPTHLIAGALDAKYVALARAMAAAIPGSSLSIEAGAGHAVHVERPAAFAALVRAALAEPAAGGPAAAPPRTE